MDTSHSNLHMGILSKHERGFSCQRQVFMCSQFPGNLQVAPEPSGYFRDTQCHSCCPLSLISQQPSSHFSPPQPYQRAGSTAETGMQQMYQPLQEVKQVALLLSASLQGGRSGESYSNKELCKVKYFSLNPRTDTGYSCAIP